MRFAITAADRYLGIFEAFIQAGWTPLRLFTLPVDTGVDSCRAVTAFASRHHAAVQYSQLTLDDLQQLKAQNCDALIVASYPWRIPDWEPFLKYAINFHAAPLPEARGPYPLHRAILENRSEWGITCHRITPKFDQGAVLAAEHFPLHSEECHESLNLKIQMAGKTLAAKLARDLPGFWLQARPQIGGSYWPLIPLEGRIIDFKQTIATVLRHVRAFGRAESLALSGNGVLVVTRAAGWLEQHHHEPGTIMHIHDQTIVVTAADGYISLFDVRIADPIVSQALAAKGIMCQTNAPLSMIPVRRPAA